MNSKEKALFIILLTISFSFAYCKISRDVTHGERMDINVMSFTLEILLQNQDGMVFVRSLY